MLGGVNTKGNIIDIAWDTNGRDKINAYKFFGGENLSKEKNWKT